ncbi:MAG: MoaD/ThiS family protein [Fimbriimonadaceae bacterium]|nr:MoaD/ThiS family protein [Fimbriimonadaceae bacterium]
MRIVVRAFAAARELLGAQRELDLPAEATVGTAWAALCELQPGLAAFQLRGLAVNRVYAPAEQPLHEGDEVAVIPPVSGG